MKRVLTFILLIVSGALLRASDTISVLTSKEFGKLQKEIIVVNKDKVISHKTNISFGNAEAFLHGKMIVSYDWDKIKGFYFISFYTQNNVFKCFFPEIGAFRAYSNKDNLLAIPLTNTEIENMSDLMDFGIVNPTNNEYIGDLSIVNNHVRCHLKKNKFCIAYFDEIPRGAGITSKTILLKVINAQTNDILIVDKLVQTDFSYENKEMTFVDSSIQWLNDFTFIYMKMRYFGGTETKLYLYAYNIKKKNRKLIKEISFLHSIEKLKFQLVKDNLYLMNRDGIFSIKKEFVRQLLYSNNLSDFHVH